MGYLWLGSAVYDRDGLVCGRWAGESYGYAAIHGVGRGRILVDRPHENYDLLLVAFGYAHVEANSATVASEVVHCVSEAARRTEAAEHCAIKKLQQSGVGIVTELTKHWGHGTLGRRPIGQSYGAAARDDGCVFYQSGHVRYCKSSLSQ